MPEDRNEVIEVPGTADAKAKTVQALYGTLMPLRLEASSEGWIE